MSQHVFARETVVAALEHYLGTPARRPGDGDSILSARPGGAPATDWMEARLKGAIRMALNRDEVELAYALWTLIGFRLANKSWRAVELLMADADDVAEAARAAEGGGD